MPTDHLTMFFCGDVMAGRGIDQILPHPNAPELREPYVRDAREYVEMAERVHGPIPRGADLGYIWGDALDELDRVQPAARVITLETSLTESDDYSPDKQIHYRLHPSHVGCLSAVRPDACVLANNHVLDFGRAGLLETLDALTRAGLQPVGAGRTLDEAWRPALIGLSDRARLVVFGFGTSSSGIPDTWAAGTNRPGVAWLDDPTERAAHAVRERVAAVRRPGDVVVASVHWGSNWGYDVPPEHVAFARQLVDGGIDIVHGHSSHHVRPIEIYKGRLVLYGCGDFLNDYEGITGQETFRGDLALMYFVTVEATTAALVDVQLTPMQIRNFRLARAAAGDADWLRDTLSRISRPFGSSITRVGTRGLALQVPEGHQEQPRGNRCP